jgi:hypothetical protein
MVDVLSPEGVRHRSQLRPAPRLSSLAERRIGLHDNRKPGAVELLGGIAAGLAEDGVTFASWHKAHAARPTPHLAAMSGTAEAVVLALGD